MASSGPNAPGTVASVSETINGFAWTTVDWVNPNNAKVSDNTYATHPQSSGNKSYVLRCTNFSFGLASTDTVVGVVVEIECKCAIATGAEIFVYITKGGAEQATSQKRGQNAPAAEGFLTFGGAADMWSQTLAYSDVNASTFGVGIASDMQTGSDVTSIDFVRITVYYTPANTAPTITAGPTTTYASGSATYNGNTWGGDFTAQDADPGDQGAGALTYYIAVSATYATAVSTHIATGTCTHATAKSVTGLAYNATGLAEGANTLYVHVADAAGANVHSSFVLHVAFAKVLSVTSTGTPTIVWQVGKALSVTSTGTASIVKSVGKTLSVTSTGTATLFKSVGKIFSAISNAVASLTATRVPITPGLAGPTVAATLDAGGSAGPSIAASDTGGASGPTVAATLDAGGSAGPSIAASDTGGASGPTISTTPYLGGDAGPTVPNLGPW